jgi:hypothetical protein
MTEIEGDFNFHQSRLHTLARAIAPQGVRGAGRGYEPDPLFFTHARGTRL